MVPDATEVSARLHHLVGLPFTFVVGVVTIGSLVGWCVLRRVGDPRRRDRVVVSLSLAALLAWCGPWVAAAWVAYTVVFRLAVERLGAGVLGRVVVTGLLLVLLVVPVAMIGELGTAGWHVRALTAFASNMAILRFWAYAVDRWRQAVPALSLTHHLLAQLFFPTFVNGPVESVRRLAGPWPRPTSDDLRHGAARALYGVVKMVLVALVFPADWMSDLGRLGTMTVVERWGWAVALYGWFFLGFSAWSDVAIGLARICGHVAPENFDAPWRATTVVDFWHRWHVSFGVWLRDYVYIPLGGNRRHRWLNVLATFVVSAAWHVWGTLKLLGFGYFPVSAWSGFLLWGMLHAFAVLATRRHPDDGGRAWVARGLVFLFAAWAWIPFFRPANLSTWTLVESLARMWWPF